MESKRVREFLKSAGVFLLTAAVTLAVLVSVPVLL